MAFKMKGYNAGNGTGSAFKETLWEKAKKKAEKLRGKATEFVKTQKSKVKETASQIKKTIKTGKDTQQRGETPRQKANLANLKANPRWMKQINPKTGKMNDAAGYEKWKKAQDV